MSQITLSNGVTTLALNPDLYWSDEHQFSAVEQSVERSLSGALIVQHAVKTAGRNITLQPADEYSAWTRGAVVDQLRAWEAQIALVMTLTIRGTAFDVIFNRTGGSPIEAPPVTFVSDSVDGDFGDWYRLTIRFLTV